MKTSGHSPSAQRYPRGAYIRPPSIRPRGRFTVEARGDDLWIFFGPRRRWGVVAFTSAWLCGWAFGEVMVIAQLFRMLFGPPSAPAPMELFAVLFMLVWLCGWTIAGLVIHRKVFEEVWGWEEIYLSRSVLLKRTRLSRWTRDVVVPLETVREFRITSPVERPKDWEKVLHIGESWTRGLVAERGDGKLLFLVREYADETASPERSVVECARKAFEQFRIPVVPLGPEPSEFEALERRVKEFRAGLFAFDREEDQDPSRVRPTGPKPLRDVLRQWSAQITLVVFVVIGWVFWVRTGGVPSLFLILFIGYLLIFLISLPLILLRRIGRIRAGKPWSPPLKGTWKDEFRAFGVLLLLGAALGGLCWVFLFNIPSKDFGRWDRLRRHVYSVGGPDQIQRDRAGNLYTVHELGLACPRVHKYDPDGRLLWVISAPRPRPGAPLLDVNPDDGTLTFQTEDRIEVYDSDGRFLSSRPLASVSPPGRAPRRPSGGPA